MAVLYGLAKVKAGRKDSAEGLDVMALREKWQSWCSGKGTRPQEIR
ncbi:MAG: hypothetical protein LBQ12_08090 [Deltaproteobacteria bacterium]|nr:hypothetical protein [Deltaproteobacteria bacterium]